jgi:hypothetical protein
MFGSPAVKGEGCAFSEQHAMVALIFGLMRSAAQKNLD